MASMFDIFNREKVRKLEDRINYLEKEMDRMYRELNYMHRHLNQMHRQSNLEKDISKKAVTGMQPPTSSFYTMSKNPSPKQTSTTSRYERPASSQYDSVSPILAFGSSDSFSSRCTSSDSGSYSCSSD